MAYMLRSVFTLSRNPHVIYFPPERNDNEDDSSKETLRPNKTPSTRFQKALQVVKSLTRPLGTILSFPVILVEVLCCSRRRNRQRRKRVLHEAGRGASTKIQTAKEVLDQESAAKLIQSAIRRKLARYSRARHWKVAIEAAEEYQNELARRRARALAERLAREKFAAQYVSDVISTSLLFTIQTDASSTIQRVWRGYRVRKVEREPRRKPKKIRKPRSRGPIRSRFSADVYRRVWSRKEFEPEKGWPGKESYLEYDMWEHAGKPPHGRDYGLKTYKVLIAPRSERERNVLRNDFNAWVGIPYYAASTAEINAEKKSRHKVTPLIAQYTKENSPYGQPLSVEPPAAEVAKRVTSGDLGWKPGYPVSATLEEDLQRMFTTLATAGNTAAAEVAGATSAGARAESNAGVSFVDQSRGSSLAIAPATPVDNKTVAFNDTTTMDVIVTTPTRNEGGDEQPVVLYTESTAMAFRVQTPSRGAMKPKPRTPANILHDSSSSGRGDGGGTSRAGSPTALLIQTTGADFFNNDTLGQFRPLSSSFLSPSGGGDGGTLSSKKRSISAHTNHFSRSGSPSLQMSRQRTGANTAGRSSSTSRAASPGSLFRLDSRGGGGYSQRATATTPSKSQRLHSSGTSGRAGSPSQMTPSHSYSRVATPKTAATTREWRPDSNISNRSGSNTRVGTASRGGGITATPGTASRTRGGVDAEIQLEEAAIEVAKAYLDKGVSPMLYGKHVSAPWGGFMNKLMPHWYAKKKQDWRRREKKESRQQSSQALGGATVKPRGRKEGGSDGDDDRDDPYRPLTQLLGVRGGPSTAPPNHFSTNSTAATATSFFAATGAAAESPFAPPSRGADGLVDDTIWRDTAWGRTKRAVQELREQEDFERTAKAKNTSAQVGTRPSVTATGGGGAIVKPKPSSSSSSGRGASRASVYPKNPNKHYKMLYTWVPQPVVAEAANTMNIPILSRRGGRSANGTGASVIIDGRTSSATVLPTEEGSPVIKSNSRLFFRDEEENVLPADSKQLAVVSDDDDDGDDDNEFFTTRIVGRRNIVSQKYSRAALTSVPLHRVDDEYNYTHNIYTLANQTTTNNEFATTEQGESAGFLPTAVEDSRRSNDKSNDNVGHGLSSPNTAVTAVLGTGTGISSLISRRRIMSPLSPDRSLLLEKEGESEFFATTNALTVTAFSPAAASRSRSAAAFPHCSPGSSSFLDRDAFGSSPAPIGLSTAGTGTGTVGRRSSTTVAGRPSSSGGDGRWRGGTTDSSPDRDRSGRISDEFKKFTMRPYTANAAASFLDRRTESPLKTGRLTANDWDKYLREKESSPSRSSQVSNGAGSNLNSSPSVGRAIHPYHWL